MKTILGTEHTKRETIFVASLSRGGGGCFQIPLGPPFIRRGDLLLSSPLPPSFIQRSAEKGLLGRGGPASKNVSRVLPLQSSSPPPPLSQLGSLSYVWPREKSPHFFTPFPPLLPRRWQQKSVATFFRKNVLCYSTRFVLLEKVLLSVSQIRRMAHNNFRLPFSEVRTQNASHFLVLLWPTRTGN